MVSGTPAVVWDESQVASDIVRVFKKTRRVRWWVDKLAVYTMFFCAALVLVPLFSILIDLLTQGFSALNLDFFTQLPKPVGEAGGGMANAIAGSLILLGLALLVGVPVGLGSGIYLSEYAGTRFANIVRFITDVMNGIPSIVYGILPTHFLFCP